MATKVKHLSLAYLEKVQSYCDSMLHDSCSIFQQVELSDDGNAVCDEIEIISASIERIKELCDHINHHF